MLISTAYAQSGGGAAADPIGFFLPLVLIFVVFYFLMIRPQQKRAKQHKAMIGAVRRGDTVVTAGGIIGRVSKVVDDNEMMVEIAEGVRVRVARATVTEVRARGEPAAPAAPAAKDAKEKS
jgi:preprotein translocase subunit YajC